VEIQLSGGNATAGVVRVGETVRRPAGPWTPAVHALLLHLHEVGFRGAPRPLGMDEQGREVLSYASGTVPWPDRFDLLAPEDRLARVGRLIRDLHDALEGFTPPPDARWQTLMPAPTDASGTPEMIIHHDLAPWNLVMGDEWVFIDWDVAAPGTRLWDLAYAAHGFVPLAPNRPDRPPGAAPPNGTTPDDEAAARLRVLADAYGLDEAQRRVLVPLLARRTRAMYDFLADQSARGNQPWTRLWQEGHGTAWDTDTRYIEERGAHWEQSLLR
jgi:hypothetical protein